MTASPPRVTAATSAAIPVNLRAFLAVLGAGEHGFGGAGMTASSDPRTHVQRLEAEARGEDLPAGHVPMTTFWLLEGGDRIVGMSRLRHALTAALRFKGGHIGFSIAPAERRRGHGATLLRATVEHAAALGIDRALLTTDHGNLAARTLIERVGGIVEDGAGVRDPADGSLFVRYWILSAPASGRAP